jgi:hypothetical protein
MRLEDISSEKGHLSTEKYKGGLLSTWLKMAYFQ